MYSLINDLLDVSAIEAGKLDLQITKTDPAIYLRTNFEANSIIANSKSIKLKLDVEPGLPAAALDPKRIDQVISNLITNAIKFSYPEHGDHARRPAVWRFRGVLCCRSGTGHT